ncbi:hypothetical protein PI125_g27081 [Phytophthora idaei]|nr:hypothetical protein PI125_g27081 [Phytophthora idaei]
MVDEMYADINNPEIANDEYFANRTILTTTNAVVQRINEAVAQRLEGVSQEYLSTDSVDEDEEVNFFRRCCTLSISKDVGPFRWHSNTRM